MQPATRSESELRIDLAAGYRYADQNGWADLIFNHITARSTNNPEHLLIKPHALMFAEVTASSLLTVTFDGAPVGNHEAINAAALTIHTAVLMARPEINAVMHIHSKPGLAISARAGGLRYLTQESMMFFNRLAYHDFEGLAHDLDERGRLARDLGSHKAMILRNHGLLTCGRTVQEAVLQMRDLVIAAEAQLTIEATGAAVTEPSPRVCEHTARQFEAAYGRNEWMPQWNAVKRSLDRTDASYKD